MNKLAFFLAGFATTLLFFSCKDRKLNGYRYGNEDVMIEIRTTPCFGRCPVYEMSIDGMGMVTFTGERDVKKVGAYQKQLTAEETNKLFAAFEDSDYWAFEDEYSANVTDLPSTYLTYKHGEKAKKIRLYYNVPDSLANLSKMVKEIATSDEGWSAKTTDS